MARRKTTEPPAPWERPSRDPVTRHLYGDGWTYRACSVCGRPPEANCHQ
jgi:hypothetical protein